MLLNLNYLPNSKKSFSFKQIILNSLQKYGPAKLQRPTVLPITAWSMLSHLQELQCEKHYFKAN